jgi:DNA-binding CsgD family transcriptional regulator
VIFRFLDPVLRWRRRVLWQVDKDTALEIEKGWAMVPDEKLNHHNRLSRRMLQDPRVRLTLLPCILTDRELEVLIGAARGETAGKTARRLGIQLDTVKRHRFRLIHRMAADNIAHAVALAVLARWITEKDLRGE